MDLSYDQKKNHNMNLEQGYLYIATGDKYIEEALVSLKSLRKADQDAHVTLITDRELQIPEFDMVICKQNENQPGWKSGILYRIQNLKHSPYQKTFFIDSDTYFCDNCQELFYLLDFFDLCLSSSPADPNVPEVGNQKLKGYYPYNAGVLVYKKNDRVRVFLDKWAITYQEKMDTYPQDQPAFMETLLFCDLKTYTLQNIYNARIPYIFSIIPQKVKIIHGRHQDYQKVERKLNSRVANRVWHPVKQKVIFKRPHFLEVIYNKLPESFKNSYKKRKKNY